MEILLMVVVCVAILILVLIFATRKVKLLADKTCSICGAESKYGYSEHAEEHPEKTRPMCLKCLVSQLERDYTSFGGQAVVVQPAEGPPCYVFQPVKDWHGHFKESTIASDVASLLAKMETTCHDCGLKANYLWTESSGFTGESFAEILDKGLSATLLRHNPPPVSLCPACCVRHIAEELNVKGLSYLEVSAPKGIVNGFVIPMGY